MVDNFSNKKVSDFIYKGFDEQPHKCANPKSCSHPYHKKEKEKEKSENKIVSEVKSIFESAKMSVTLTYTVHIWRCPIKVFVSSASTWFSITCNSLTTKRGHIIA